MSLAEKLLEKYGLDQRVLLVPIKCLSVSPFTVGISGDSTPVDALQVDVGLPVPFSVNDTGMALWLPPGRPICFKTI